MKRFASKLRSCAGESLIEVLAALLIAILSSFLLFNAAVNAAAINRRAADADDAYRSALNAAELFTEGSDGTLTIRGEGVNETAQVEYSGKGGLLVSFRWKEED